MKMIDFNPVEYESTVHSSIDIFDEENFSTPELKKGAEDWARQEILKVLTKRHGCVIHSKEDSMKFGYVKNVKNYMENIKNGRHKIL